jgi:phosphatidylglycerol:prolipoprotein diacylglycerol transferase
MRPVLFVWRGFKVRSFPVMMYLASLTGMLVTMWAGRSRGLPPERTGAAVLALLCCVFLGARLFYVLMNWKSFSASGWPIFARSQGGMTFSGGLLLGLLVLPPILSSLQLPLAQFCDATGLGMLAGLPVAKAGCFLHGCCCGRPTASWIGVDLPDHNGVWARRFPTQFLELAWSASLFLLLRIGLLSRPPLPLSQASAARERLGRRPGKVHSGPVDCSGYRIPVLVVLVERCDHALTVSMRAVA